jgi:hypothetical protein
MKWFVASTYTVGNVIVRAKNKSEVQQFLNDNDYEAYSIETLNVYFNNEVGEENNIIITLDNIIS